MELRDLLDGIGREYNRAPHTCGRRVGQVGIRASTLAGEWLAGRVQVRGSLCRWSGG
jgi:hypothetical protein